MINQLVMIIFRYCFPKCVICNSCYSKPKRVMRFASHTSCGTWGIHIFEFFCLLSYSGRNIPFPLPSKLGLLNPQCIPTNLQTLAVYAHNVNDTKIFGVGRGEILHVGFMLPPCIPIFCWLP